MCLPQKIRTLLFSDIANNQLSRLIPDTKLLDDLLDDITLDIATNPTGHKMVKLETHSGAVELCFYYTPIDINEDVVEISKVCSAKQFKCDF
jgi:hypothetical protein